MDPAARKVPEWLNSSLWSSSSSSPSSSAPKRSGISPSSSSPSPSGYDARRSPSQERSASATSGSTRSICRPVSDQGPQASERQEASVSPLSAPLTNPKASPPASLNAAFPTASDGGSPSVPVHTVFPPPSQLVDSASEALSFPPVSGNDAFPPACDPLQLGDSISKLAISDKIGAVPKHRNSSYRIGEQTAPRGEVKPAETEEPEDLFNVEEAPLSSPLPSALFISSISRSTSFDSRVTQFHAEISKKVISISELQRLSSQGIPDSGNIRAITWKLLLGYLPRNRDLWSRELEKKRAEYMAFKRELLVTPSEITRVNEEEALDISNHECRGPLERHDISQADHPLNLGTSSLWHQFFLDSEVWEQIDRDVKRTHPDMHFFCGDSKTSLENQEAMKRVLFVFSKLNSGIRYVQGMNEVLAPLYYVFRTDTDESNPANAEADSFFCFVSLLGDFRDHFVQQLDNSAVGIRATISRLNNLLKKQDEELWRHLEHSSKVNPQFYAFRWITLLLTQEFDFADSLRLWDSLLANPEGPLEILLRVCCAMLMSVRSRLLAGDFTSNLKLLQHYPSIDIHHLLRVADSLK